MIRFLAGKRPRRGLDPRRVFGNDEARLRDSARELRVRDGVVAVDAAAENGHGGPTRLERTSMRLAVDATSEPAHDGQPRGGQLPPEQPRHLRAV
jgi:hypothetical protein